MTESPQYLRGNYVLETVIQPDSPDSDEDLVQKLFERRCDQVQARGVGLAGSVPYIKIVRKDGKFIAPSPNPKGGSSCG